LLLAGSLLTNRLTQERRTIVAIELDLLKTERDKLKEGLREVEAELRKLEADVKLLRQREIQSKREIEALTTLIEIKETREPKSDVS